MIDIRKLKKFISVLAVIVIILSIVMPEFSHISYLAATVKAETQGTTKKPIGIYAGKHEFYEYHRDYDKRNVLTPQEDGGGMGEGGGAGDNNTNNAGNGGYYNDAGGTFGQAAGSGLGTGNSQDLAGKGASTTGGYTGSATADAIRSLKSKIEQEREESIARVLETANDKKAAKESIAKEESIKASIQKKLQQESVKAKIAAAEKATEEQYETPVYVEATTRKKVSYEYKDIDAPTTGVKLADKDDSNNNVMPTDIEYHGRIVESIVPYAKAVEEYKEEMNAPTVDSMQNDADQETTLKLYDAPVIPEESTEKESLAPSETMDADENKEKEKEEADSVSDEEEGKGSKGGEDSELDKDKRGEDGENETEGEANELGKSQLESSGKHEGKKVFDLDMNGNIGLNPDNLATISMRGIFTAVLTLLFLLGALSFILATKDNKSKRNYF